MITIIIIIIILLLLLLLVPISRAKRLHNLRNHRGLSVAFSDGISHDRGIFLRIATCPADFHWNCPMDFQWHLPMELHLCDCWCAICCPELNGYLALQGDIHLRTARTPNLPTNIMDFRGFDSGIISSLRGGSPRPIGNFLRYWV